MKRVKVTHIKYKPGKKTETEKEGYLPSETFHFSDEDKKDIFDMIHEAGLIPADYAAERYFMLYLEHCCTRFLWLKDAPKREDHRNKINDAKKSIKKTIRHLTILETDYLPLVNLRVSSDPYIIKNYCVDAENQAVILDKLRIAKENLNSLIKEIQKYEEPKSDKSKTSGRITTQLFGEVAKILDMQYQNVTLTKYRDGFFIRFCETLLKKMRVPLKDISRACKKAIDALAEEKKKPLFWIEKTG